MINKGFTKEDLREVYETYFEPVRNFLYYKSGDIELSSDIVQEVFIKVWKKRNDIKRETLESLLFTVANNLLMNHFNHVKVVRTHEHNVPLGSSKDLNTPQFLMEEQEFEDKLNAVLNKLPPAIKEVFLMNRIDKIKYNEIAKRLDISVKTVEMRMSKAISILKQELGRKI